MMANNAHVQVEFVCFSHLERDGSEYHRTLCIHAFNDLASDLISFDGKPEELFRLSGDDIAIELRRIENPELARQLNQDNGFYSYNEWVHMKIRTDKRKGLCQHCHHYAMVQDYNGKPCCDLCILTIRNQKKGNLGR